MKNDKYLLLGFLGIISTIPSQIFSTILKYFGFAKYSMYDLASLIITFNRPSIIMGLFVDALISGTLAIIFCLIFEKLGSDYLVIKTMLGSFIAWLAFELLLTSTIEGKFIAIRPMRDYYSHILGTMVFGIMLGVLIKRFYFSKSNS